MTVVSYGERLRAMDLPEPKRGPGEVLVKVLACGVCYTDMKTARGRMPHSAALALPHVPGHEICGEVIKAPSGSGLRSGQRVVVYNYLSCGRCLLCRLGRENLCQNLKGCVGLTISGGFQEFLVLPPDRLLPFSTNLSDEQAAILSCAVGTAYRAVVTRGAARPGDTVVVLGVGGVGVHAVQVARISGAQAVAVDFDPRKLQFAASFCEGRVVTPGEKAENLIRKLTGIGADIVVDTVGKAETLAEAIRLSRPGGRIVGVGYQSGVMSAIPADAFVVGERDFLGSRYCTLAELQRALALVVAGQVQPIVDSVVPLDRANEAFERLERGEVIGRMVLRVA
jgi:2-desacetyl-2-hydroxyethyl bacteriochlorophyllide A dehydrogenase